jgi:hypothetical protein
MASALGTVVLCALTPGSRLRADSSLLVSAIDSGKIEPSMFNARRWVGFRSLRQTNRSRAEEVTSKDVAVDGTVGVREGHKNADVRARVAAVVAPELKAARG